MPAFWSFRLVWLRFRKSACSGAESLMSVVGSLMTGRWVENLKFILILISPYCQDRSDALSLTCSASIETVLAPTLGGAMVVAGRPQEPLRSQDDACAMHLLSSLMRRLIIVWLLVAAVTPCGGPGASCGSGRMAWAGALCSENDTNRALAPLLSQRGNAGMLVVQPGLPALPQSQMLYRRITHVGLPGSQANRGKRV